ncbi:MAG: cobalamin B12-binding domain-containing protein, partial [Chloroherpetonaceae bacterium]|nr:cobalamin B12-binding domain-containing protein [Chthonomonadaceae bacterium]MDW8208749.1 cobalamin B12-binding domain-containing protein [Chloroherpetonaceae bacterium]
EQFLQGLLCGQEEQIASVVNAMLAQRLDLLTIYLQVFQPALYRIGDLYAKGEITVAQEHLASAHVERMMARVAQFYTPVRRVPWRALMGCVAHNWHVIGLRMLADALRMEGWEILFLGANVPTSSFVDMAVRTHPDLIVISCSLREHLPTALDLVTQLDHLRRADPERQFQIAVGGNHLFEVRETLQAQGVNLMAADLRTFLQEVHRLFVP